MTRRFRKMYNDILSRADLTATAKLVYSVLADRQGENGYCWPGIRTLAKDIGASKGAVERAVNRLEAAGLITANRGNKGYNNKYVITVPETETLPAHEGVPKTSVGCPRNDAPTVPKTGTEVSPKRVRNQTKQLDSKKQTKESDVVVPDHLKDIWPEWVQYRKELEKPLTPTAIKRQLASLAKEQPAMAVRMIEQSITNGWQGLFTVAGPLGTPKPDHKTVQQILDGE